MRWAVARWGAVILLVALAAIPPAELASWPVACVFRRLWGWECFGCGLTRALNVALHGDLAGAMSLNRLVVLVLPALTAVAAWRRP
jgi:hypothetical protein